MTTTVCDIPGHIEQHVTSSACEIENLPLRGSIINSRGKLKNRNKDEEGASPQLLSRIYSAKSEHISWREVHAEGEVVHTEVTGDTGQWTSRHLPANELNISNLWAGTK